MAQPRVKLCLNLDGKFLVANLALKFLLSENLKFHFNSKRFLLHVKWLNYIIPIPQVKLCLTFSESSCIYCNSHSNNQNFKEKTPNSLQKLSIYKCMKHSGKMMHIKQNTIYNPENSSNMYSKFLKVYKKSTSILDKRHQTRFLQ